MITDELIKITEEFSREISKLQFSEPVTHVYNPLEYARKSYGLYLQKYAAASKRVIFLGMNPGPWGMAQTGIPFGEIAAVKNWLGIKTPVGRPALEHPKKKVEGFNCPRSEVSGRRLWGYFARRFQNAETFFKEHLVTNYCPLVFMEFSGKNRTPDKLPLHEHQPLFALCDRYLADFVDVLTPRWVIGIGGFAEQCCLRALKGKNVRVGKILHPSPASPAANRGWGEAAEKQLTVLGIWPASPFL